MYKKMKSKTKEDIESGLGLEAHSAWLLNACLERQERTSGNDLSYLKCQVPQIDMSKWTQKRNQKLQEMMKHSPDEKASLEL